MQMTTQFTSRLYANKGLFLAVALSASLLTACGGGGGSSASTDNTGTTNTGTTGNTTTGTTTNPTTTTPATRTFTKMNLTGAAYVADGSQTLGCVKDSKDNKFWEVKSNTGNPADSDFRDVDYGYFWGDNVGQTAGGAGTSYAGATNPCSGVGTALTKCDTASYVKAVNAMNAGKGLCNKTTWRLPTSAELLGLLNTDATKAPYIYADIGNTAFDASDTDGRSYVYAYWSSTPVAGEPGQRVAVSFTNKLTNGQVKNHNVVNQINNQIRLIAD
jgi:Protein of unknown function (DUF1566).